VTALPRELDVRAQLPARPRRTATRNHAEDQAVNAVLDEYYRAALDEVYPADDRIRAAASLINEIGPDAIVAELRRRGDQHTNAEDVVPPEWWPKDLHPGPGVAVLACACGAAIDAADMRRAQPVRPASPSGGSGVIRPIVCPSCARA
jgi:hypothetical protein